MKERFDWLELFDTLVFSCELGINKPDRRIYDACLRMLDLSPRECLFVDDIKKNVGGAIESGMHGILFKSFAQFRRQLDGDYLFSL
jgi:putative hydrolase of the HAD superfamily